MKALKILLASLLISSIVQAASDQSKNTAATDSDKIVEKLLELGVPAVGTMTTTLEVELVSCKLFDDPNDNYCDFSWQTVENTKKVSRFESEDAITVIKAFIASGYTPTGDFSVKNFMCRSVNEFSTATGFRCSFDASFELN